MGGVSYEKQPFTENWGTDFDLNIDGNIIQQQFWGAVITPSWSNVGWNSTENRPMIVIWRDATSAVNSIKIIVYSGGSITTLASTPNYSGLMNRSWYHFRILVDKDRLVRIYYNGGLLLQYWLPTQYKSYLGNRSLSFLNQTSAWSEQKNFRVFDHETIFKTETQWNTQVKYDDFNRANGAVGNGWTVHGTSGQIVSNSYSVTGGDDGSRAVIADTGSALGAQRVEAVIGGAEAPKTNQASGLIVRCNAAGTEGIIATVTSGSIFLSKFTGSLTSPTLTIATSGSATVQSGNKIALSAIGDAVWVEVNGVIALMADASGQVPLEHSYAGVLVSRGSFVNSASWNDARILLP